MWLHILFSPVMRVDRAQCRVELFHSALCAIHTYYRAVRPQFWNIMVVNRSLNLVCLKVHFLKFPLFARFDVLRAMWLKIHVLRNVTSCRLLNSYIRSEEAQFLRTVCNYLAADRASHIRRPESSRSVIQWTLLWGLHSCDLIIVPLTLYRWAQTVLFKDPVRTAHTFHLGYKNQSVYGLSGTSRCLFWDKYKTHK